MRLVLLADRDKRKKDPVLSQIGFHPCFVSSPSCSYCSICVCCWVYIGGVFNLGGSHKMMCPIIILLNELLSYPN